MEGDDPGLGELREILTTQVGLSAMIGDHAPTEVESAEGVLASKWLIMARDPDHFGTLPDGPIWREARASSSVPAWTDDFSNILDVISWRAAGSGAR